MDERKKDSFISHKQLIAIGALCAILLGLGGLVWNLSGSINRQQATMELFLQNTTRQYESVEKRLDRLEGWIYDIMPRSP